MHKTVKRCIVAGGFAAMCMALLMGFAPQGNVTQVRRPISFVVETAAPDTLAPLAASNAPGAVWVGTVSHAVRRSTMPAADATTPENNLLLFTEGGVALLVTTSAGHGVKAVEAEIRANALVPLVLTGSVGVAHAANDTGLLDPAALYAAAHGRSPEVLGETGVPLRFTTHGRDACAVSSELLEQLLVAFTPPAEPPTATAPGELPPAPTVLAPLPRQRFDTGSVFARAERYRALVSHFAERFSLDPALVYAIIHAESSFRTGLVSPRSAMGLMQLLPSTAGGEVHRFLHGSSAHVTLQELSNPETNIRYGTAYLYLLLNRHMAGITHPRSRQYCAVASYNMGPHGFLKLFGSTREEAIAAINALTPDELWQRLTTALPVRETRNFVAKVTRAQQNFATFMVDAPEK